MTVFAYKRCITYMQRFQTSRMIATHARKRKHNLLETYLQLFMKAMLHVARKPNILKRPVCVYL